MSRSKNSMVSSNLRHLNKIDFTTQFFLLDSQNNFILYENEMIIGKFSFLSVFLCNLYRLMLLSHFQKPATPQPSIVVEDDNIKIYVDWTFICSSNSIEQALAILVGLYCLMNLKFHAYRTAVRFLYVYFLGDTQQQSNSTRRFFKEYNIELQDTPSLPINQLEDEENGSVLNLDEPKDLDQYLTVVTEENNKIIPDDSSTPSITTNAVIRDDCSIPSPSTDAVLCDDSSIVRPKNKAVIRKNARKRKIDQLHDPKLTGEDTAKENDPPTKKTIRSTRRKRY